MTARESAPKPEPQKSAAAVETRSIEMGDGRTACWIDRDDGTSIHFRVRQPSPPKKVNVIGDNLRLLFLAAVVVGFILAAVLSGGGSDSRDAPSNVIGGYELPG